MRRFHFALRPVAVLRAHRELQARERFAAAVHRCARAQEELAGVRRRIAALEVSLLASRQDRYQPATAGFSVADYCRESAAEVAAEKTLLAARQEMQARRLEYVEEHRRLEVVRRLEEKARNAHQAATRREEQAAFDDLSGARFQQTSRRSEPGPDSPL